MNLHDAIAQYADMVALGSQALNRLAEHQLYGREKAELAELLESILGQTEQLKDFAMGTARGN